MEQCEGQLDVFEIIADIEAYGLMMSHKRGGRTATTAATVRERGQGETGTAGAVANPSGPPLWHRGSSPQQPH